MLTGSTWRIFRKFGEGIGSSETSPHWFSSSFIDGKVHIPRGTGLNKLELGCVKLITYAPKVENVMVLRVRIELTLKKGHVLLKSLRVKCDNN